MNLDALAKQFGGSFTSTSELDDLASRFGGNAVSTPTTSDEDEKRRREEAVAYLEAERQERLKAGDTEGAAARAREIARMQEPYGFSLRKTSAQPATKPAAQPTSLDSLAQQFGGAPVVPPKKEEAKPYRDRREALDDAVNLLEEGAPTEAVKAAFERGGIQWTDIVAHGQRRGSEFFKRQPTTAAPARPVTPTTAKDTIKPVEPTALEEVANLGRRGVLQFEREQNAFRLQTGQIDPTTYAIREREINRKMGAAAASGDVADGLERLQEANQTGSYKEVGKALVSPSNWKALASLVAESAIPSLASVPYTVAGVMVAGPVGAGAATGAASFAAEFSNALGEKLQDRGIDLNDVNAVEKALNDPKFMAEVKEYGTKRGIPVAAFDALSAGFAGRFIRTFNNAKKLGKIPEGKTGRAALSASLKEAGIQVGAGMAGEKVAQIATDENKPLDVLVEGLAELPSGVVETATNVAKTKTKGALTVPTVPAIEESRTAEEFSTRLQEQLTTLGIPEAEAKTIADNQAKQFFAATQERLGAEVPTSEAGRLEERIQEFIGAGFSPEEARTRAEAAIAEEDEADALATAPTEATEDVARTVEGPSGAGVSVAEQQGAGLPATEGATESERTGVVPVGSDVAGAAEGEGREPPPVTPTRTAADITKEISALEEQRMGLLTKNGRLPAVKSPARKKYDELVAQIDTLNREWDVANTAERATKTTAPAPAAVEVPSVESAVQGVVGKATAKLQNAPQKGDVLTFNADISANSPSRAKQTVVVDRVEPYRGSWVVYGTVWENGEDITKGVMEEVRAKDEDTGAEKVSYRNTGLDRFFLSNFKETQKLANELTPLQAEGAPTTTTTKGAPVGTQTAETVQTETQGQEAAAPTVKRGRPPLTPEAKAEADAKRQAAKNTSRRADAATTKLNALLDAKLDPANYTTVAELKEAQAQLDNARAEALRTVLTLEPDVRGTAAGKRLKATLARPEIPAKQMADVKQGVELTRKNIARSEATGRTAVSEPNEGFKSNTNGVQSLGTIIKGKAPAALKAIAQRLRGVNAGVKFQVIEDGDPLPEVLERNRADWDASRGVYAYDPATGSRTIYVKGSSYGADQGANDITVLHENLHAATAEKIKLGLKAIERGFSENSQLVRATRDLLRIMDEARARFEELDARGAVPEEIVALNKNTGGKVFNDALEFLAYGMSDPDFQQFLMSTRGREVETSFFTRFVDAVRRLLGMDPDATNALTDLIVATDKIISARKTPTMYFLEKADRRKAQLEARAPEIAPQAAPREPGEPRTEREIERDVAVAKEKVRISTEGEPASVAKRLAKARNFSEALAVFKDVWGSMSAKQREAAVRLPTMDFLVEWMEKDIPRLKQVSTYIKDMNGMATTFLDGNAQLLKAMQRAFKDDPALQKKLSDLVYASTLARIDPADPNARERSRALDADYAALGASGQAVYKMMRDYYKGVHELYRLLLDQQVQNLSGVTQEVKDNILSKIRQEYERGEAISPYFPLVRRGDFWLSVGTGKNRQFYMFESQVERDAKARELAAERRTSLEELLDPQNREFEIGNNIGELRAKSLKRENGHVPSQILTSVFDQIDQQDFAAAGAREGLKDAIYQIYLQTMPEQSFRNMFIHRKGTAGFSTDLLRNTATTASRMSMQLARLKYAPLIRNSMSAAKDSIVGRPELLPFIDEMDRRANMALSGQEGGVAQTVAGVANKASYIWYLSSASSALIQPFSILISGVPVLTANHASPLGASAEIAKAIAQINQYGVVKRNVDGTTSYVAPSLANNTSLPADERRAIREMARRGVQQSTYSSLVFEYKNNASNELEGTLNKGAELGRMLVGGLMHNTERLTREALYIASYRLGRKRGLNFEEAVDQAVVDVNEALADYDISNRPRWMQQGLGRIAFQFKMYPLHIMLLLATNFKRMLPLLNKEGKAAAATKFFGIVGTTGLLAGAAGLPGFSAMMGVAAWAMKQMADDDELPDEFKDKDFETWFRTVFLKEKLGDVTIGGKPLSDIVDRGVLNAITGTDIASRIGLNDLWFRDGKEMKTARESAIAFAIDNFGGPTASLILQMIDAYEAFMYGDYQKGLEKASPSLVRNLLVANKYEEEGIKTARGAELIPKDDVTAGMLWAQAIGFRPDQVAKVQQNNFKMTGVEQKILFERAELMKKVNIAHRQAEKTGDYDRFDKVTEQEIEKFNRKNPEYRIEGSDITKSIKTQAEARETAQAGYVLNKKNARLMEEMVEKNLETLEPKK